LKDFYENLFFVPKNIASILLLKKQKNVDTGTRNQDFEGEAWIYLGVKRDSKVIVGHRVGKRIQDTCDRFLQDIKIELTYQLQQILEIFCDGNSHYRIGLDKINDPTGYHYGQLVKEMIEIHVSNIIRQWIVGMEV